MDIEFHYYITYLAAARAGFNADDAYLLAYSCQYVDDNYFSIRVSRGTPDEYHSYVSQTVDITKPALDLMGIYPLFHMVPGDFQSPTAARKDGKLHLLTPTPDSAYANTMLQNAFATNNLYRMGIACHAYADTWAHQNFIGFFDAFNSMSGGVEHLLPAIGHAQAKHDPDLPGLIWIDHRLRKTIERVDNKKRFIEAACKLYAHLCKYRNSAVTNTELTAGAEAFAADLDAAIGAQTENNDNGRDHRILKYKETALKDAYGKREIPVYDEKVWLKDSVNGPVDAIRAILVNVAEKYLHISLGSFEWKHVNDYKNQRWFQFQEAIKAHQKDMREILEPVLSNLELSEYWKMQKQE